MVTCKCVNCVHLRDRKGMEPIMNPSELFKCQEHDSTKTTCDVYALRDCGQYIEGDNPATPCPKKLPIRMGKCQRCKHLKKLSYVEAYPTHHENWRCPKDGHTMMYDDTCAERHCGFFEPL